jgi:hypothetical protein
MHAYSPLIMLDFVLRHAEHSDLAFSLTHHITGSCIRRRRIFSMTTAGQISLTIVCTSISVNITVFICSLFVIIP